MKNFDTTRRRRLLRIPLIFACLSRHGLLVRSSTTVTAAFCSGSDRIQSRRRLKFHQSLAGVTADPVGLPVTSLSAVSSRSGQKRRKRNPMPAGLSLLLDEIESEIRSLRLSPPRRARSIQDWNKFLHSLASTRHRRAGKYAHSILDFLRDGSPFSPNLETYNIVLNAYSKSGDAPSAQKLFDEMESSSEEEGAKAIPSPNKISYNTVIHAWSHSKSPNAAQYANSLLEISTANNLSDAVSFNGCIDAWAKSGDLRGYERAEGLFNALEDLYERDTSTNAQSKRYKPDIFTYMSIIDAFAKSHDKSGAQRAEGIVKQMHERYQSDPEKWGGIKPNLRCFNGVLNAWAARVDEYNTHSDGGGGTPYSASERAEKMLNFMEEMSSNYLDSPPDVHSYNTVLKAWANSGNALKVQSILNRMEDHPRVVPDLVSYNIALNAYAKKGQSFKAEQLFIEMDNNPNFSPDVISYTALIDAYAQSSSKGSAQQAERILESMIHKQQQQNEDGALQLNTIAFNAVINAWVKSGEWNAASNAEQILNMMETMSKSNKMLKPNVRSYSIVIDGYAKSNAKGAALKARDILNKMEAMGDVSIRPNGHTYTSVINAIGRSSQDEHPDKASQAQELLLHMEKLYVTGKNRNAKPNVFTYNAVLNACAYTEDSHKYEAFKIACFLFNDLRKKPQYGSPTHVTYGTFLRICSNFMTKGDESRDSMIKVIWKASCREGQVGDFVLRELRDAGLSEELLTEFFGGVEGLGGRVKVRPWKVKLGDLPDNWRCNVRERRRTS